MGLEAPQRPPWVNGPGDLRGPGHYPDHGSEGLGGVDEGNLPESSLLLAAEGFFSLLQDDLTLTRPTFPTLARLGGKQSFIP